MTIPSRNDIKVGIRVSIETKENQDTGKLTEGNKSNAKIPISQNIVTVLEPSRPRFVVMLGGRCEYGLILSHSLHVS